MNPDDEVYDPTEGAGCVAWIAAAVVIFAALALTFGLLCGCAVPQLAQDALGGLIPSAVSNAVPVVIPPATASQTPAANESDAYKQGWATFYAGGDPPGPYGVCDPAQKPLNTQWNLGWQSAFSNANPTWTEGKPWHR